MSFSSTEAGPSTSSTEPRRAGWFTFLLLLLAFVGDGWSGRPIGLRHQILLLPLTAGFVYAVWQLLRPTSSATVPAWRVRYAVGLALALEVVFGLLFLYEAGHFAQFGYRLHLAATLLVFVLSVGALIFALCAKNLRPAWLFVLGAAISGTGLILAIASFPLNYLRSDMLAVILWADRNLLHHISPYATMYVGGRVYDFPYLPGMLVAYLPFVAARLDIRVGSLVYLLVSAGLVFWAARLESRLEVAALLLLFLLNPFLQYRHELYLEPHWLTLVAAVVLMQRRRFVWAAFVWGISIAVYQFSWIVFPFVVLNAFRRRNWSEAAKVLLAAAAGALLIAGPFLRSAAHRIASNTVGQWAQLPHALADPINLSYWATYIIRPEHLMRLQAVLMVVIFAWCIVRRRCATLEDTLRCSIAALTVFILFNSIVDGYFYLMLLVPMLLYVCVANGWFAEPTEA